MIGALPSGSAGASQHEGALALQPGILGIDTALRQRAAGVAEALVTVVTVDGRTVLLLLQDAVGVFDSSRVGRLGEWRQRRNLYLMHVKQTLAHEGPRHAEGSCWCFGFFSGEAVHQKAVTAGRGGVGVCRGQLVCSSPACKDSSESSQAEGADSQLVTRRLNTKRVQRRTNRTGSIVMKRG